MVLITQRNYRYGHRIKRRMQISSAMRIRHTPDCSVIDIKLRWLQIHHALVNEKCDLANISMAKSNEFT